MGRKKIEIKPLTDERNRNVTFLKRKAGLMKKAWELSVLCSADVSIVIFAPSGKCFEFTSVQDGKGLDGQVARYVDYEGSIERRRAPEFAAAAAQGDDDSGDEDAVNSKKPAAQGSLKGKEEWKEKTVLAGGSKKSTSSGKRQRQASVSDGSNSRSRSKSPPHHYPHPQQQQQYTQPQYGPGFGIPTAPPIRTTADPSAIQYALSMNNTAPPPQPSLNSLYNTYPPETTEPAWDSQTLARLAEFQLQQDHQRQQRALLERQRRQLMDLGVPTNGDPAFMEMIFGNGGGQRPNDPFLWPTTNQQQQQRDESHHSQAAVYARGHQTTPFTFPNRAEQQQQQQAGPSEYWENHESKPE